eukprot:SAG22_NODE_1688_length_3808_cov_20.089782_2_plen_342_part_00
MATVMPPASLHDLRHETSVEDGVVTTNMHLVGDRDQQAQSSPVRKPALASPPVSPMVGPQSPPRSSSPASSLQLLATTGEDLETVGEDSGVSGPAGLTTPAVCLNTEQRAVFEGLLSSLADDADVEQSWRRVSEFLTDFSDHQVMATAGLTDTICSPALDKLFEDIEGPDNDAVYQFLADIGSFDRKYDVDGELSPACFTGYIDPEDNAAIQAVEDKIQWCAMEEEDSNLIVLSFLTDLSIAMEDSGDDEDTPAATREGRVLQPQDRVLQPQDFVEKPPRSDLNFNNKRGRSLGQIKQPRGSHGDQRRFNKAPLKTARAKTAHQTRKGLVPPENRRRTKAY